MDFSLVQKLTLQNDSKVVLMILDGLGGIPGGPAGKTELDVLRARVPQRVFHLLRLRVCVGDDALYPAPREMLHGECRQGLVGHGPDRFGAEVRERPEARSQSGC